MNMFIEDKSFDMKILVYKNHILNIYICIQNKIIREHFTVGMNEKNDLHKDNEFTTHNINLIHQ